MGTTTHFSLPYPDETTAPPDVAADIQTLASAVDTALQGVADDVDAIDLSALPKGRVGGQKTAGTGTLSTVEEVLTGLGNAAFTAVTGRTYRVTVTINDLFSSSSSSAVTFRVRDGGTVPPTYVSTLRFELAPVNVGTTPGNNQPPVTFIFELTGLGAGVHRLGLFGVSSAGAPKFNNAGSAARVSTIVIDDVGAG